MTKPYPFKTRFWERMLLLVIVRTSPDHGTAFDLAGSGKAREESLVVALKTAAHMVLAQSVAA